MKRTFVALPGYLLFICMVVQAQSGPPPTAPANGPQGQPVSYASVTELNGLLSQLETTSKNTQDDLMKLRIERWKADNSYKKQQLGNIDSVQRNLQGALPEIISKLRSAPEDLPTTFKLYRNLDALYDVLGSVAEGAGAFGSKDDLQSLSTDLNGFESTRRQLAERIENLSSSKEQEIARLRTDLKAAQATIAAEPPKKVVVDDTEPPKKPATTTKKKTAAKKPITPDNSKPPAGQGQSGQAQPQSQPQGQKPQ